MDVSCRSTTWRPQRLPRVTSTVTSTTFLTFNLRQRRHLFLTMTTTTLLLRKVFTTRVLVLRLLLFVQGSRKNREGQREITGENRPDPSVTVSVSHQIYQSRDRSISSHIFPQNLCSLLIELSILYRNKNVYFFDYMFWSLSSLM